MLAPGRPVLRPPKRRSINPINLPCAPAQRALWGGAGVLQGGWGPRRASSQRKQDGRVGVQPDWVGPEGLDLGAAILCGPDLVPPLLRTSGARQREGGTDHR